MFEKKTRILFAISCVCYIYIYMYILHFRFLRKITFRTQIDEPLQDEPCQAICRCIYQYNITIIYTNNIYIPLLIFIYICIFPIGYSLAPIGAAPPPAPRTGGTAAPADRAGPAPGSAAPIGLFNTYFS